MTLLLKEFKKSKKEFKYSASEIADSLDELTDEKDLSKEEFHLYFAILITLMMALL